MTELHDILGQIPIGQIAGMLGTDQQTARAAVEAAVPTLLAGMQNNARAPEGAAALESALSQHQDGLAEGGVDASRVDTADGEKIVSHVFGGQQDQVASQLAGTARLGGAGGDLVRKLLPILAPIVMSYLAKKVLGGRSGAAAGTGTGGVDLGSILGGLLGGGALGGGGAGGGGARGGLGDLLGGLLGGGQPGGDQSPSWQGAAEAGPAAGLEPGPFPQGQPIPQGQPGGGAPRPGELIEVDLPGSPQEDAKNSEATGNDADNRNDGGLGGLLDGLFGKK